MYQHIAHFYDLFDHDDPEPLRHASLVLRHTAPDADVLDVGAGTGRAAMFLAEAGLRVWCIEPSAAMRMILLGRVADDTTHDALLTVLPGDAHTLDLGRQFDAIAACHLLYLLDDETLALSLDRMRAHLRTGGRLIGDFALAAGRTAHARTLASTRRIGEVDYRKYTVSQPLTSALWRVRWQFESWRGERLIEQHEETFDVRVRDSAACRDLLHAHGFSVHAEFGDYAGAPWRDDARAGRYVFVAA